MSTRKLAGTPKAARTDNLNLRFEPRLKYLAGIAARHERRTLSHLVENAVAAHLQSVAFYFGGKKVELTDLAGELWATKESERFVSLAEHLPFLLTFEEEQLWELIQERGLLIPDKQGELELTFEALQAIALQRASEAKTVTIGGFPSRGGRIDTTLPEALLERSPKKVKKERKGN